MFERSVVGLAHVDLDGRWLRFNQRFCDILGYSREELASHTFQDVTHPDDLAASLMYLQRVLTGELEGYELDKRYLRRDGTPVWVHLTVTLVHTPEGAPDYFISMVQDITERKRLEREREAARVQAEHQADQLDRIFEAAADGLIVWDADGRLVRDNPAARRMLGLDAAPPGFQQLRLRERLALYAARDEQGRPVPSEEWPIVYAMRGEVGAGEGGVGMEAGDWAETGPEEHDVRVRAFNGRELELTCSAAPLRDREGHLVGAVTVLHDRTERNRLAREREAARADELAAREANRRMEQFLAIAAHDLRTPLTATIGYLDLAQHQAERLAAAATAAQDAYPALTRQVATVRDRLEDADQGAARLARLLTLLFDTAALRANRLELRRAPCDLAALVRECVTTLRAAAPLRTIRLHSPAPAGDVPIPVEVDADRVGQVITNFVSNALKYAPPDRPIDVSVLVRGSRLRVAVCDQGPGILEAERARVWELFHRAPGVTAQSGTLAGATAGVGGSLGLGLHICKAIVEAHGGRVGVKSTVGQGSTFWFTLPLSTPLSGPTSGLAGATS
jgi:PAS domain S-box-containing protein